MKNSRKLYAHAQLLIPGGVNSPVRAFRSVGGTPLFLKRGKGAWIWDADGNSYVDYVGSWGPLIVGHAHPDVVKAVQQAAEKGLSFGAPPEPAGRTSSPSGIGGTPGTASSARSMPT